MTVKPWLLGLFSCTAGARYYWPATEQAKCPPAHYATGSRYLALIITEPSCLARFLISSFRFFRFF